MVYKVIGLMSGSSLDGIDIVYTELEENAGKWSYSIISAICLEYDQTWIDKLNNAISLNAKEYLLLHADYGHFLGKKINDYITAHQLEHQVHFIACHGHTTFHLPELGMTHQLGDGAAIAAETALPVITDLRSLDVALGGQGAPVVPIGDKLLFSEYELFLNLGGIANMCIKDDNNFIGYDICPANKVLNMLAENAGKSYDADGIMASAGIVNDPLLHKLNTLSYYSLSNPKSLSNSFGIEEVFPIVNSANISNDDKLRTYVAHIVGQVYNEMKKYPGNNSISRKILVTGGGALNTFLIKELTSDLHNINVEVIVPSPEVINFKEALVIALMGALRWREQNNVMKSVTGSSRNNIGGALWLGSEG